MHANLVKTAFAALTLLGSVHAHTRFTTLFVNGKNQGDAVCIRMDMNGETTNGPLANVQSPEMACGRNGETGVSRVCPTKAGDTLTFQFREWVQGEKPGGISPEHGGPCAIYLKKVVSAIASNNAAGDGWFKIWQETYDESAGKWCTEKLRDSGHLSATLPSDIEPGYYLARTELLALHEAQNKPPYPQFYVGCAQIYVESTGSAKPATVSIPQNYVDMSTPGLTYNIYKRPLDLPYPMFGPPVYQAGRSQDSSGSSAPAIASRSVSAYARAADDADEVASDNTSDDECDVDESDEADEADEGDYTEETVIDDTVATTAMAAVGSSATPVTTENQSSTPTSSPSSGQTEGLKPEGCIMVNGNWCGFEVKSYTDEPGCWSSSEDCWKQSQACYKQTPPTGAKNCDLWVGKCDRIVDTCRGPPFTGPPEPNKDLTPTPPDLAATASRKLMALVRKHESHVMRRAYRARD